VSLNQTRSKKPFDKLPTTPRLRRTRRANGTVEHELTFSNIFKLAAPAVISHAIIMLIGVIDLAFVGRLSNATFAIAAVAIGNNICTGIYNFFEGIRSGTTVITARFLGAQQPENISKTIKLAIMSAIIVGVSLLFFMPFLINFLYSFVKDQQVQKLGFSYLSVRLLAIPFLLTIFAIAGFFRGLKNTIIPLFIAIGICVANIVLNFFLLKKGIHGVALATFIAYIFGAFLCVILLLKTKLTKKYVSLKIPVKSIFKEYVKTATEIGLYYGIVVIAFFFFSFMFFNFGAQAIAAHQIILQVFIIAYLPPMGLFVATTVIIGKLLGGKQFTLVTKAIKKLCLISVTITGIVGALMFLFAPQIAKFFSPKDLVVAKLATKSMYILPFALMAGALFSVFRGALMAAKDTRFLVIAGTLTSYLFFLPLSYLLAIKLNMGIYGGYISFATWFALDTIVFSWRFFKQRLWGKG
jgi:multidrug resistance protein, MATE family